MPEWRACLAGSAVQPLQHPREPAAFRHPPPARHAAVEAGSLAEMPRLPQRALRAAGAHDQADGREITPYEWGTRRRSGDYPHRGRCPLSDADRTWLKAPGMSQFDPKRSSPADLHRDETIDSHLLARKETENGGIERRWIVPVHGVSGIGDHHRLGNVLALSHHLVHCAVSLRAPLSIQQ